MNVTTAVTQRRSVRTFLQKPIPQSVLEEICQVSRLYPSGANRQPIRMKIINDPALCREIFPHTRWAGYIKDYQIKEDQQPTGYILLVSDKTVNADPEFDAGAIATILMLLAKEQGLDTCCIGSFNRKAVAELLKVDEDAYAPLYLLALGYSDQVNRVEPYTDTIRYRYEDGSFIVPKYDLQDLLI